MGKDGEAMEVCGEVHSDREWGEERNVLEWRFLDESQDDDTAALIKNSLGQSVYVYVIVCTHIYGLQHRMVG